MTISGNPKKMAQDIAEGFLVLSPPGLKIYTVADLKILLGSIELVRREFRQSQVPLEDVMLIKAKNMRISRLNQAETVLRNHARKMRLCL